MILTQFPDMQWLQQQIAIGFKDAPGRKLNPSEKGWPSVVLNVNTSDIQREHIKGPLSIFMNKSGTSRIGVDGRELIVTPDTYTITNSQDHYDLVVDKHQSTETFNIHFGEELCNEAVYYLQNKHETLLDNFHEKGRVDGLYFRLGFKDETFQRLISNLESAFKEGNAILKEENQLDVLQYILHNNNLLLHHKEELSATKKSTKEELIRRVLQTVDFIHAHYMEQISLEKLSELSCLSKFHYSRVFKSLFKVSPYVYIKSIRLQKALELLQTNTTNVHAVAGQVGFENGSSLSRFIKQQTGQYPTGLIR